MVNWLLWIVLLIIFYFIVVHDRKRWDSIITPAIAVNGSYLIVLFFYNAIGNSIGAVPLQIGLYLVLILTGLLSLMVSFFCSLFFTKIKQNRTKSHSTINHKYIMIAIWIVSLLFIRISVSVTNGALWNLDASQNLGHGFSGHLHVFLGFLLIWYATKQKLNNFKSLITIIIGLFSMSTYPIKGWTLIPMIAITLTQVGSFPSLKRAVIGAFVGFIGGIVVFFGIYLARVDWSSSNYDVVLSVMDEVSIHFADYAFAGMAGLNEVVQGLHLQGGLPILFAPFVNIYNFLAGLPLVSPVSNKWIWVIPPVSSGNVYSLLGSLIGYAGYLLGMIIFLIILIIGYILKQLTYTMTEPFIGFYYFYISILSMGWFEYYYWHLSPYEFFAWTMLIGFAFNGRSRRKIRYGGTIESPK
jgi:hypothetical protein